VTRRIPPPRANSVFKIVAAKAAAVANKSLLQKEIGVFPGIAAGIHQVFIECTGGS